MKEKIIFKSKNKWNKKKTEKRKYPIKILLDFGRRDVSGPLTACHFRQLQLDQQQVLLLYIFVIHLSSIHHLSIWRRCLHLPGRPVAARWPPDQCGTTPLPTRN
jgi:hypothetical protein